jgi:hypothetical protein
MSSAMQDIPFKMWMIHWNRFSELVKRGLNQGLTAREMEEVREALVEGSQNSHQNSKRQWVSVWPTTKCIWG